jgi:TPR repeat protein
LNYFEASFLLETAAQGGNVEAQFRWGTWLLEGIGVPHDLEGARNWLESAAKAGHSRAALALATSYRPFIDTGFDFYSSTDIDQALFWLNQAMAAEIPEAFYLAGRIHFDGDGDRPPDRRKAEELLGYALQLGLDPQFEGRAEFVFSQAESLRISRQRAMEQQALQVFFIGVLLYGAFNGGGGSSGSQDCHLAACKATFSSTGNAGADMLGYSLMMR